MMTTLRKWMTWRRLLRAVALLLAMGLLLQVGLIATVHVYGITRPPVSEAEALVVLGAGVNRDGRAGPALTRRSTLAAQLYLAGAAPTLVCTGGQPPDRPATESSACAAVLQALDVPPEAIQQEPSSRSTEENALNVAAMLPPGARVIVVSDSFHLLRAGLLFRARGFDVQLAGVPPERSVSWNSYWRAVIREAAALQWQFVKDGLGLDITWVPFV